MRKAEPKWIVLFLHTGWAIVFAWPRFPLQSRSDGRRSRRRPRGRTIEGHVCILTRRRHIPTTVTSFLGDVTLSVASNEKTSDLSTA